MKNNLSQWSQPSDNAEVYNELSLTVPDMALDISAAVKRMQQGLEVSTYVPLWDEDLGIDLPPDFDKMDRTAKLDWAAETRQEVDRVIKQQQDAAASAERAAAQTATQTTTEQNDPSGKQPDAPASE